MDIRIATGQDREAVFALRFEVFVSEQNVPPEIEVDNEDERAIHVIAQDDGIAVGCARVITEDGSAHIGRLAVKKAYRRHGVGRAICNFIIDYCRQNSYTHIWLNSQLHAASFYEGLGFVAYGDIFSEAGIEHISMEMYLK